MPAWKLVFWSVVGFAVPVALGAFVAPIFFSHSVTSCRSGSCSRTENIKNIFGLSLSAKQSSSPSDSLSGNHSGKNTDGPEDSPSELSPTKDGLVELPSLSKRQRSSEDTLLVSVKFRLDKLPETGKRVRLLLKYANQTPYPGWGIAIRSYGSSLRPEVYWRGSSGEGGWMSFEDVHFQVGQIYRLSFVAQRDQSLSLYLQSANTSAVLSPSETDLGSTATTQESATQEIAREVTQAREITHQTVPYINVADTSLYDDQLHPDSAKHLASRTYYVGGYHVGAIGSTETKEVITAPGKKQDKSGAIVAVSEAFVSIVKPEWNSREEIMKFVSKAPETIASLLPPDDIALWFRGQSNPAA